MATFDVLAVGELNPDLILSGIRASAPRLGTEQAFSNYTLTLGSSTAIACVLMQRLGLRTAMAARVGDDDYGRFCRMTLGKEGVDAAGVLTDSEAPTGVTISLPYPEDRLLLTCYGTMDRLTIGDINRRRLQEARHLHLGSFFIQRGLKPHLAQLFREARELGLTTSLDTGWDPDERWLDDDLRATLAVTDIFVPNETEMQNITGTSDTDRGLQRLLDLGVGEVLLKQGAQGSVYAGPLGRFEHKGFKITPVDTTGAGDACNAGYLAARLEGLPPSRRLMLGNACGALTAAAVGGTGGLFSRAQAEAFIAANT